MKMIKKLKRSLSGGLAALFVTGVTLSVAPAFAAAPLDGFSAHPPIHIKKHASASPVGLDPATIKAIYNLSGSGSGTIAIVDAYHYPTALNDLNTFSAQYGLPTCGSCFEQHLMAGKIRTDSGWALEAALDTQWAHAIAPGAKILLVEAKSARGSDLLNAVDYARARADVVAVSMSWGGSEFSGEATYNTHFTSNHGVTFFASSGDNGAGVSWPAVSPNVVGVGGTTLSFVNGSFSSETAWSGSGGGISAYENEPGFQTTYGVSSNGKRAVPDVSYDGDPASGVSVYDSTALNGQTGWYQVGGTSAGTPQWAGIRALGPVTNAKLYQDAKLSNSASFLRDIVSGTNGTCGALCTARTGYDMVTGLGSPVTSAF
jgi:subtilase family serine protease